MAAIDHTCIVWKNAVYIPDRITNPLPFEYGRDGGIWRVQNSSETMIDIFADIKWYRDEYDAVYQRKGLNRLWCKPTIRACIARLNWLFRRMERKYYENEVGVWRRGDTAVYIYHDAPKQSYASFYKNDTDTYVILGGYGHHENVYCHFMNRGYGDEFERKIVSEAYQWLCRDILGEICDAVTETWDEGDELLRELRGWFGKDFTAAQINTRKD